MDNLYVSWYCGELWAIYWSYTPFHLIGSDCAVPNAASNITCNQLTAVVINKTYYVHPNIKNMTISFGRGKSVSVNAIIGLPTNKECKLVWGVDAIRATSKLLNLHFNFSFQHEASEFSAGVTFCDKDFIWPKQQTSSGLALPCRIAASAEEPIHLTSTESLLRVWSQYTEIVYQEESWMTIINSR